LLTFFWLFTSFAYAIGMFSQQLWCIM